MLSDTETSVQSFKSAGVSPKIESDIILLETETDSFLNLVQISLGSHEIHGFTLQRHFKRESDDLW